MTQWLAGYLVVAVIAVLVAVPAVAQPSPAGQAKAAPQPVPQAPRPYRGLFGAGSPSEPGAHLLDLNVSVYGEYGSTRHNEAVIGSPILGTGWFLGVRGGLSFEKSGQQTRFGLRTEGALRYYQDSRQTTLPRFSAEMGVDTTAGKRHQHTVRFGGTVAYEPYYILSLFDSTAPVTGGTAVVPTSRDDLLYRQQRYVFGQSFNYEHQFTPRSYLRLSEGLRFTKAESPAQDVQDLHASAGFGHRFSRYSALRIGYGYQLGRYALNTRQRLETHDIDLSLDYRRPLTRSRRTTVGFSTGSSLVTAQQRRQWEFVGVANLRRELGSGWFIQSDVAREVRLVEGFMEPFLANSVTANVGGFLSRRLELLTSGAYSRGTVGFGSDRYTAAQGSARLRLALASFVAIDAEGLASQHRFDARIILPGLVFADLNRWAVRCNVALWLPLSR